MPITRRARGARSVALVGALSGSLLLSSALTSAPAAPASLLAVSATASPAAPTVTPTAAAPSQALKITGTLAPSSPKAKRPVKLQRLAGSTWTAVASATTTKRAAYSFSTTAPAGAGTYGFRVAAPKVKVTIGGKKKTLPALTSAVRSVIVTAPAPPPPPDTTAPPVPTGLVATPGETQVALLWSPVTGPNAADLAGYVVFRATNSSGPWTQVNATPQTGTDLAVTGLTNGTEYWFAVASKDATGNVSGHSTAVNSTPSAPTPPPDTTPPPVPAGPTPDAGDGQVGLTWTAVSGPNTADLAGYEVYRALSAGGPWIQLTTTTPATSYVATGLTNGTTYYFAVTSKDTTGNESAKSSPVASMPVAPPPVDTTPPPVPTGVIAQDGDETVGLTWTAVVGSDAADLAGYFVYRATAAGGPWTRLTANPTPALAYTSSGLTNGTTYFFAVSSVDTIGNESARSTAASATPENYAGPHHCGDLPKNETWQAGTVHVLDCTVTVPAGITLTIKPGAVVKAQSSAGLTASGTVNAVGTAAEPIVFTSIADDTAGGDTNGDGDASGPGNWLGIRVTSSGSFNLIHAALRHATIGATVQGGVLHLTSTTMSLLGYYGVVVESGAATIDGGAVSAGNTDVYVASGASASVEGTSFSGSGIGVAAYPGSSTSVADSHFERLRTGVLVYDTSTVVTGSTFTQITDAPVLVSQGSASGYDPKNVLEGNTATDSAVNGIWLQNPVFADGAILAGRAGWGLVISNLQCCGSQATVNVPAGATVTVPAGGVVKFRYRDNWPNGAAQGTLRVAGTLNVTGAVAQPAVLTSFDDDTVGGDTDGDVSASDQAFYGLSVTQGGHVTLMHARLSHGRLGISVEDGGTAALASTVLDAIGYYGLDVSPGGTATVTDSDFVGGVSQVSASSGATLTVRGSTFAGSAAGSGTAVTANPGSTTSVTSSDFHGLKTGVLVYDTSTVVTGNTFDQISEAPVLVSQGGNAGYDPVNIVTGNVATNSTVNGVWMQNPVFANGSVLFGRDGWGLVISNFQCCGSQPTVNIPAGVNVTVPAGAVVKFRYRDNWPNGAYQGTLRIAGTLAVIGSAGQKAGLTSFDDDSRGGDTDGDAAPSESHFYGLTVLDDGFLDMSNAVVSHGRLAITVEGGLALLSHSVLDSIGYYGVIVYDGAEAQISHTGVSGGVSQLYATSGGTLSVAHSTMSGSNGAGTAVSANPGSSASVTDSTFNGLTTGVLVYDTSTVVIGNTFDHVTEAPVLVSQGAVGYDPTNIKVGNTATNSGVNGVWMQNPVFADGAALFGRIGWGLVISNFQCCGSQPTVNVPVGSTVTVPAGAVVKFRYRDNWPNGAYRGQLRVAGTLTASGAEANPAVFTSFSDDAVGGNTDGDAPLPNGYHFEGIQALDGSHVTLGHVDIRQAQLALAVTGTAEAEIHGRVADSTAGVSSDGVYVDATQVDWGSITGPDPYGDGVPVLGYGVQVVPWTGYQPPPRPPVASPQPVPDDNGCADVTIFGLRGSGEDPKPTWNLFTGWSRPDFGESQEAGFGGNAWDIRTGFKERLAILRPDDDVKAVGIQYMGHAVPVLGVLGGVFPTPGLTEYIDSIYDGVDRLIARMRAECESTQFVLVGYSQGALAIHIALRALEASGNTAMLDRVAGVGLVADPGRVLGGTETLWGGAYSPASWLVTGSAGAQASLLVLDSTLSGPLPASVTGRTVSICHDWDMVCGIHPGAFVTEHLAYKASETKPMGDWLAENYVSQNRH